MKRRDFIVDSCAVCFGATALQGLLTSCKSTRYVAGAVVKDGITISADEFKITTRGKTTYRSFIVIRNEILQYPIYVHRFSETEYTALWMRCSHQGTELQASGDYLHCPAHGSEFNNRGKVTNSPADTNLRSFPIVLNTNELFIDLRKS